MDLAEYKLIKPFLASSAGNPRIEFAIGVWSALAIGCALLCLLIGNVIHDDRLVLSGVSVNALIFALLILVVSVLRVDQSDLRFLYLGLLPTLALLVSVFWSNDIGYGLFKFTNLWFSTAISFLLFVSIIRDVGVNQCLRLVCVFMLVLFVLAVIFKLKNGFFDRDVPFFMNGPIIFARLMSLGGISALFVYRGAYKVLIFTLFFAATLWTESKGPLIGLLGVFIVYVCLRSPKAWRPVIVATLLSIIVAGFWFLTENRALLGAGRLLALVDVLTGSEPIASGSGSFGSRFVIFAESIGLIADHPLGAGLGGWESTILNNMGLKYPHNLILEVVSEAGIVLGSIALLPFIAFVAYPRSAFSVLALYFFVVQQVSGDLQDARFLLLFSLLAVWVGRQEATTPSKV